MPGVQKCQDLKIFNSPRKVILYSQNEIRVVNRGTRKYSKLILEELPVNVLVNLTLKDGVKASASVVIRCKIDKRRCLRAVRDFGDRSPWEMVQYLKLIVNSTIRSAYEGLTSDRVIGDGTAIYHHAQIITAQHLRDKGLNLLEFTLSITVDERKDHEVHEHQEARNIQEVDEILKEQNMPNVKKNHQMSTLNTYFGPDLRIQKDIKMEHIPEKVRETREVHQQIQKINEVFIIKEVVRVQDQGVQTECQDLLSEDCREADSVQQEVPKEAVAPKAKETKKAKKEKVAKDDLKEVPKSPKISWFSKSSKSPKESEATKVQEDLPDHKPSDAEKIEDLTDIPLGVHEEDLEFRTIDQEVQTEPELLNTVEVKKGKKTKLTKEEKKEIPKSPKKSWFKSGKKASEAAKVAEETDALKIQDDDITQNFVPDLSQEFKEEDLEKRTMDQEVQTEPELLNAQPQPQQQTQPKDAKNGKKEKLTKEDKKEISKSPKISWFSKSGKKVHEAVKIEEAPESADIPQDVKEEDLETRTVDQEVQTEPEVLDEKQAKKGKRDKSSKEGQKEVPKSPKVSWFSKSAKKATEATKFEEEFRPQMDVADIAQEITDENLEVRRVDQEVQTEPELLYATETKKGKKDKIPKEGPKEVHKSPKGSWFSKVGKAPKASETGKNQDADEVKEEDLESRWVDREVQTEPEAPIDKEVKKSKTDKEKKEVTKSPKISWFSKSAKASKLTKDQEDVVIEKIQDSTDEPQTEVQEFSRGLQEEDPEDQRVNQEVQTEPVEIKEIKKGKKEKVTKEDTKDVPKSPKISWFSRSRKASKSSEVTKLEEELSSQLIPDAEETKEFVANDPEDTQATIAVHDVAEKPEIQEAPTSEEIKTPNIPKKPKGFGFSKFRKSSKAHEVANVQREEVIQRTLSTGELDEAAKQVEGAIDVPQIHETSKAQEDLKSPKTPKKHKAFSFPKFGKSSKAHEAAKVYEELTDDQKVQDEGEIQECAAEILPEMPTDQVVTDIPTSQEVKDEPKAHTELKSPKAPKKHGFSFSKFGKASKEPPRTSVQSESIEGNAQNLDEIVSTPKQIPPVEDEILETRKDKEIPKSPKAPKKGFSFPKFGKSPKTPRAAKIHGEPIDQHVDKVQDDVSVMPQSTPEDGDAAKACDEAPDLEECLDAKRAHKHVQAVYDVLHKEIQTEIDVSNVEDKKDKKIKTIESPSQSPKQPKKGFTFPKFGKIPKIQNDAGARKESIVQSTGSIGDFEGPDFEECLDANRAHKHVQAAYDVLHKEIQTEIDVSNVEDKKDKKIKTIESPSQSPKLPKKGFTFPKFGKTPKIQNDAGARKESIVQRTGSIGDFEAPDFEECLDANRAHKHVQAVYDVLHKEMQTEIEVSNAEDKKGKRIKTIESPSESPKLPKKGFTFPKFGKTPKTQNDAGARKESIVQRTGSIGDFDEAVAEIPHEVPPVQDLAEILQVHRASVLQIPETTEVLKSEEEPKSPLSLKKRKSFHLPKFGKASKMHGTAKVEDASVGEKGKNVEVAEIHRELPRVGSVTDIHQTQETKRPSQVQEDSSSPKIPKKISKGFPFSKFGKTSKVLHDTTVQVEPPAQKVENVDKTDEEVARILQGDLRDDEVSQFLQEVADAHDDDSEFEEFLYVYKAHKKIQTELDALNACAMKKGITPMTFKETPKHQEMLKAPKIPSIKKVIHIPKISKGSKVHEVADIHESPVMQVVQAEVAEAPRGRAFDDEKPADVPISPKGPKVLKVPKRFTYANFLKAPKSPKVKRGQEPARRCETVEQETVEHETEVHEESVVVQNDFKLDGDRFAVQRHHQPSTPAAIDIATSLDQIERQIHENELMDEEPIDERSEEELRMERERIEAEIEAAKINLHNAQSRMKQRIAELESRYQRELAKMTMKYEEAYVRRRAEILEKIEAGQFAQEDYDKLDGELAAELQAVANRFHSAESVRIQAHCDYLINKARKEAKLKIRRAEEDALRMKAEQLLTMRYTALAYLVLEAFPSIARGEVPVFDGPPGAIGSMSSVLPNQLDDGVDEVDSAE